LKVAVTAVGKELGDRVDPRLGRAPFFLIVDTKDMSFEALANPNASRPSGAGVASAELLVSKAVEVVLTGVCGPNSYQVLQEAGIPVMLGVSGTAQQVVEQFADTVPAEQPALQPPASGGFGGAGTGTVPGGAGMGPGGGWGRGMARGMGRGWGVGAGGPQGGAFAGGFAGFGAGQVTREQEVEYLRNQAEFFENALGEIRKRLEELEEGAEK